MKKKLKWKKYFSYEYFHLKQFISFTPAIVLFPISNIISTHRVSQCKGKSIPAKWEILGKLQWHIYKKKSLEIPDDVDAEDDDGGSILYF